MLLCLFLGCCQALICLLVSVRWHRLLSVFSLILLSSVARAAFGVGSLFIKQDNQLVLFTLHYIIRQFLLRRGLVPVSTDNSLRRHLSDGQPALPWLVHWALCSLWGAPEGHHGSMCQPSNFRDPDIRPGVGVGGVAQLAWDHTSVWRRVREKTEVFWGPDSDTHPYTMAPVLGKFLRATVFSLQWKYLWSFWWL